MAIVGFDLCNLMAASPVGYSGPLGSREGSVDFDDDTESPE